MLLKTPFINMHTNRHASVFGKVQQTDAGLQQEFWKRNRQTVVSECGMWETIDTNEMQLWPLMMLVTCTSFAVKWEGVSLFFHRIITSWSLQCAQQPLHTKQMPSSYLETCGKKMPFLSHHNKCKHVLKNEILVWSDQNTLSFFQNEPL